MNLRNSAVRLLTTSALLWLSSQAAAAAVAGLSQVKIEPTQRIRAKGLDWDQEIRVALPASYGTTKQSYPVLWVTDGTAYFELAVKTVNYDLRQRLPEMIIVAVGAPASEGQSGFGDHRGYEFLPSATSGFIGFGSDLLEPQLNAARERRKAAGKPTAQGGGAAAFLAFMVEELRATLAREYRMSGDHTLFGDSGGGVFCTFALFSRPESFSRYICGSPNLAAGNFELFRMEERYAKAHTDLKATVFIGAGDAEILDPNPIVSAWGVVSSTARMAEILTLRNYPSLNLSARIFPGEDHASVVPLNLSWGLRTVWHDYAGMK
jgi:uncharacterized protein